jgi:hypothetical protein
VTTGARVALRNDSYTLHLLLPTKVHGLKIHSDHGVPHGQSALLRTKPAHVPHLAHALH